MKLKVETSKADYLAFMRHTASKTLKPHCWISMLKNVFLWIVLAFTFLSFFKFQTGGVGKQLFFSIITVSVSFFVYVALCKLMEIKVSQSFTPNENGIMIGSKEFEINSDGIKETHPYGYNFYSWNAVEQVEEINGSIYVYVDKVLALVFNPESLKPSNIREELLSTLQKYV